MRTQEYILQGKEVPAKFAGQKVQIRVPETWQECVALSNGQESSAVGLYTDAYVIYAQGKLRRKAAAVGKANDPNGLATLQTYAGTIVHERTATGTPKTAKPKTVQKNVAANIGNRMFERMLADSAYATRAIDGGFADQAEFDAWKSARQAAKAAPVANGATPAQAAEAPKASTPTTEPTRRPAGAGGGKK